MRERTEHGFTSLSRSAENGFTLVELLVSLFVFALLAAAGVNLLAFSVRAQGAVALRLADAGATARMGALLGNDLAQAVPRTIRDARGDREPAFRGGEGALLLGYVRAGGANSSDSNRSGLQRVELRLTNGRIERIAWPQVDGAAPLAAQTLADRVGAVRLRFRVKGEWFDRWQSSDAAALPRAVEMIISRPGEAALTRLFLVGTGA